MCPQLIKEIFAFNKEYPTALKILDKSISFDPDEINNYALRGDTYYYLGQFQKAVEDYTLSIYKDPNNPLIYGDRALAYLQSEQYKKTIDDCTKAISLTPEKPHSYDKLHTCPYYNMRAKAYAALVRSKEAISDCNTIIAHGLCGPYIYALRSEAFAQMGQYQQAIDDANNAADIFLKLGRKDDSVKEKKKAEELEIRSIQK